MRLEIKKLQRRRGITTIYVTHDQVEAMTMADRLVVMNGGIAEQIGTPREVYRCPQSKFVAGFIGSPAMNFAPAVWDDAKAQVTAFGVTMALPNGATVPGSQSIELGIRPEHLRVDPESGPIELAIEAVENLGNDTIVYGRVLTSGSEPIVIRMEGDHDFGLEQRVRVRCEPENIHLFDSTTGKRI